MKKLFVVFGILACGLAHGQATLTYMSYASQISIDVPTAPATTPCVLVAPGAATTPLVIKRTFMENFNTFDLRDKVWTPHYDGGYLSNGQWNQYTNMDKRRQPGMAEQQVYVDPGFMGKNATPLYLNPFTVSGGYLTIRADLTPPEDLAALSNLPFTSGLITTRKSHTQLYGFFEARVKVPFKQGMNAAFWMLDIARTGSPELDIFETPTHKGEVIQHTAHWPAAVGTPSESSCAPKRTGYSDAQHQYGALWTPERIVWYIDRVPVAQMLTPAAMSKPMYMQLNLAAGGSWLGDVQDRTQFPVDMVIDNVTAYSVKGATACTIQPSGENLCI